MLGFRYQYIFLISPFFQKDILVINIEFIIILEVEAKLTIDNIDFNFNITFLTNIISNKLFSPTSLNNVV